MTQVALPALTLGGQLAIALKFPKYGLVLALASQPFWLYSSWKAYKQAGQIGIFVNTVFFCLVTLFGVVNYWVF
ncbi:MAG: hypothetical protein US57_C0001G0011 [Candidatus Moranbacteria bacterium GW2011_GWC2_37_73]|nr:MAG: hypothetical protein UR95_C0001G0064 [Parcubacteria group bacterium GW2011_GWC1_36_108]KKQ00680.1 MAG: hypothetical protein US09_C0007G0011 [Candidatus Moranbacteria bacterium GW2011_GWD1_36_198]KKQ40401.1 MAG: hypothetical protein US57_C0001G0011 [Candidatus Moranbacteria bacterium GW2011_GWC2_37_73]